MKKVIGIIMLMSVCCIFVSCTDKTEKPTSSNSKFNDISPTDAITAKVNPTIAIENETNSSDEIVLKEDSKPEVVSESINFELIKLNLLEGLKDYYECIVYNKKHKMIYIEILKPRAEPPKMSVQDGVVNVHYGAGTGTYLDKFVDFEHNRESEWRYNIQAVGKEYIAYVSYEKKSSDSTEPILVIAKKYENNTKNIEKEYPFPYISNEWDIDKCEFRNEETELYVHYTDFDKKKNAEKTIKLSEFKKINFMHVMG